MNIGILGTGVVGRTLGAGLTAAGNNLMLGTRDPQESLARTDPTPMGIPPLVTWQAENQSVAVGTFDETAAHGDLLFNATAGMGSLEALAKVDAGNLTGKILVDVSNPLDFSAGMPPSLSVSNTDSLGEQIQRALPDIKVVKTLNTVGAPVMVSPGTVGGGDHHLLICGNDAEAKTEISDLLRDAFGWKHIFDLGDITMARATEMYLALWVRLFGNLQTPMFNIKIVT